MFLHFERNLIGSAIRNVGGTPFTAVVPKVDNHLLGRARQRARTVWGVVEALVRVRLSFLLPIDVTVGVSEAMTIVVSPGSSPGRWATSAPPPGQRGEAIKPSSHQAINDKDIGPPGVPGTRGDARKHVFLEVPAPRLIVVGMAAHSEIHPLAPVALGEWPMCTTLTAKAANCRGDLLIADARRLSWWHGGGHRCVSISGFV